MRGAEGNHVDGAVRTARELTAGQCKIVQRDVVNFIGVASTECGFGRWRFGRDAGAVPLLDAARGEAQVRVGSGTDERGRARELLDSLRGSWQRRLHLAQVG